MLKFKNLLFILAFSLTFSAFSQELKQEQLSKEWVLLTENSGVKIYVMLENCTIAGAPKSFDFVFLKFVNTNSTAKTVDLQLMVNYDKHCTGCNDENKESFRTFKIPAGATVFGDNTFKQEKMNYIIKNYNGTDDYIFQSILLNHLTIK